MERKDQPQDKGNQPPDMPQQDEERVPQKGEHQKRKPADDERDSTVGKVPDPQGEDETRERDNK
jgi:hypothetical protein